MSSPLISQLDKQRLGIITGCLLGDGHLKPGSSSHSGIIVGNARYGMTMKSSSSNYVQYLMDNVFDIFHSGKMSYYPNINLPQHAGKTPKQCSF